MKKSIVLLISLLFIAAVSLLIMKNLEDTDLYLSEQNSKFSKTQIMFLLDNTREEIKGILASIVKDVDEDKQREVLKDYVGVNFPILIEDARIIMRLEEYDKYNINLLKESKEELRRLRGSRITMVLQNPMTCFDPLYRIGNQMAETFGPQIGGQPVGAAKAADPRGQRLLGRVLDAPGIGIDGIDPGIGQRAGHRTGLKRAAKQQDARHG